MASFKINGLSVINAKVQQVTYELIDPNATDEASSSQSAPPVHFIVYSNNTLYYYQRITSVTINKDNEQGQ